VDSSYSTITFLTSSSKKFGEASALLPGLKRHSVELEEIQSLDSLAVVKHKLKQLRSIGGLKDAFVEDVSFHFLSTDSSDKWIPGMELWPGTLIKYFLESLGTDGIYKLAKSLGVTRAKGVAIIGFLDSNDQEHYFTGEVSGSIVEPKPGNFGWDPLLVPDGYTETFNTLPLQVKNQISHRAKAIAKLQEFLASTPKSI